VTIRDDSWADDDDDDPFGESTTNADITPTHAEIRSAARRLVLSCEAGKLVKEFEAEQLLAKSGVQAFNGVAFLEDTQPGEPVWGSRKTVAWSKNQGFMVFGSDGTGKSTLLQQIVLARLGIRNADVLGFPVAEDDRSILYLALDRPAQIRESISRMVDLSNPNVYDTLKRRLVVVKGPVPFPCDSSPSAFVDWCLSLAGDDCGLVIADSVKDMISSPKEDIAGTGFNDTMQRFVAKGIEFGCAHHNRKENAQNAKPRNLADVYGSRWLTAGMGSVLNIWRNPDGSRELTQLKAPYGDSFPPVEYSDDYNSGVSQISSNWRDAIVAALVDAGIAGLTDAEIVFVVFGQTPKESAYEANRVRIARQLKKWIDSGSPYQRANGIRNETACKVWRMASSEVTKEPDQQAIAKMRRAKEDLAAIESRMVELDKDTE
jgi:hypothetical protein